VQGGKVESSTAPEKPWSICPNPLKEFKQKFQNFKNKAPESQGCMGKLENNPTHHLHQREIRFSLIPIQGRLGKALLIHLSSRITSIFTSKWFLMARFSLI
jgi:hypothetical protein